MGLIINNYKQAMMSKNALSSQTNTLNELSERLSIAVKINNVLDNRTIDQSLLNAYTGTLMARANIEDTVNLLKVAEDDLYSIKKNIELIKELSVRAVNDNNLIAERESINYQIQSRMDEIERTSASSSYNGIKLLDGSTTSLSVQIGVNSEDLLMLDLNLLGDARLEALKLMHNTLFLVSYKDYRDFIDKIDSALDLFNKRIINFSYIINKLESTNVSLRIASGNLLSSEFKVRDTEIASAMSQMVSNRRHKGFYKIIVLNNRHFE